MTTDENKSLWKKLNDHGEEISAMKQRLNAVEEMGEDIKAIRQELHQVALSESRREGAYSARKWMIATMLSGGGLVLTATGIGIRFYMIG